MKVIKYILFKALTITLMIGFLVCILLLFNNGISDGAKVLILFLMALIFASIIALFYNEVIEKTHKDGDGDNTSVNFLLRYLLVNRLHSSIIHKVLALDSLNGGPDDSPSFFKSNIWYTIRHNSGTHESFNLYLSQVAELVEKIGSVSSILPNEVWSHQSRDLVRSVEYLDSLFKNNNISDVFKKDWNKIFTQKDRSKAVSLVNDVLNEQTKTLKEVAGILDERCSDYRNARQSEVNHNLDALRNEYMKGILVESKIVSKHDDHSFSDTTKESNLSDIWE